MAQLRQQSQQSQTNDNVKLVKVPYDVSALSFIQGTRAEMAMVALTRVFNRNHGNNSSNCTTNCTISSNSVSLSNSLSGPSGSYKIYSSPALPNCVSAVSISSEESSSSGDTGGSCGRDSRYGGSKSAIETSDRPRSPSDPTVVTSSTLLTTTGPFNNRLNKKEKSTRKSSSQSTWLTSPVAGVAVTGGLSSVLWAAGARIVWEVGVVNYDPRVLLI